MKNLIGSPITKHIITKIQEAINPTFIDGMHFRNKYNQKPPSVKLVGAFQLLIGS
jgi:hypothetical protein